MHVHYMFHVLLRVLLLRKFYIVKRFRRFTVKSRTLLARPVASSLATSAAATRQTGPQIREAAPRRWRLARAAAARDKQDVRQIDAAAQGARRCERRSGGREHRDPIRDGFVKRWRSHGSRSRSELPYVQGRWTRASQCSDIRGSGQAQREEGTVE